MKNLFVPLMIVIALTLNACDQKSTTKTSEPTQQSASIESPPAGKNTPSTPTNENLAGSPTKTSPNDIAATEPKDRPKVKIGIILPLEHQALDEIVAGFSEKLPKLYGENVQIKVMNAQGDQTLQRAIIQQMRDQNYDVIVPVATGVTQMTVAMIHNKPIVSLAADLTEEDRKKLTPCNLVVVHDEIPPRKLMEFLHAAYPTLKNLSLIHSTSDKVLPDVKATINAGSQFGIVIKPTMVATLPELVSATQSLSKQTEGIFILKDNLIASGAPTLANAAAARHIPFFTSDQGSVESGASFALGVHEKEIGEEGAKLAAAAILGDAVCQIDNVTMSNLTVFINKDALARTQQKLSDIETAAKKLNYRVELVGTK